MCPSARVPSLSKLQCFPCIGGPSDDKILVLSKVEGGESFCVSGSDAGDLCGGDVSGAGMPNNEPADLMRDFEDDGEGGSSYSGDVPFAAWPHGVLRNILKTRTPFAFFVKEAIHHCKGGATAPSSSALFPIPLPRDNVCY